MQHTSHGSALHPLQAEVLAMLHQHQQQLEQKIADVFSVFTKGIEQLESAKLDQHSPITPPLEGIQNRTAESRASSPAPTPPQTERSPRPTPPQAGRSPRPMPPETEQVQEIDFDMPNQLADYERMSQNRTSILDSELGGIKSTEMYYSASSRSTKNDRVSKASTLSRKRTGISVDQVETPTILPTPRPIHDIFPRIAKSSAFEMFSVCAVISNAFTIALQADWSVNHIGENLPSIFDILEIMFTCIFLVELLVRILASGRFFVSWHNRDLNWNIFDTVLVSSSILELPLLLLIGSAVNLTSARLLRLMRLVRLVRLVRLLRVFRQLRVVVQTVAASLKPLLWALILLFVVIFLSSVVILQLIDGEQQELEPIVKELYGTLMRAQYTLFLCITNGVSWQAVAEPLINISDMFRFIFIVFISFSFFCLVNIVTGIFVENTQTQSQQDDEMIVFEEAAQREAWLKQVKELFERTDTSGDGEITADEFEAATEDMKLQVMLKNIGIDIFQINPRGLFRCLDFDNNGSITIHEFAEGLMRLHGQARSLDLADVRHFVMLCLSNLERCREIIEDKFGSEEDGKKKKKALLPLPPRSSFFMKPPEPDDMPARLDCRKD